MPTLPGGRGKLFEVSQKYPITAAVNNAFKPVRGRKVTNDRIDIVSSSLCEDSLKYVAPRLEQYRGCDIIDINPGACVWSQSIHNFLRPRRHLLLEPEQRYYEPFVKPLLSPPDTNYRHSTLFGTHPSRYWDTYSKIFDGDLLPQREPLQPGSPGLRETNRTLLVTGNLHRLYRFSRARNGISFPSCLSLQHFIHASQRNDLFHRYGLVKMLLWAPTEARRSILPWLPMYRSSYNATNELFADIVEVCGVPREVDKTEEFSWASDERQRPQFLDDMMLLKAADKMKNDGITMPPGRESKQLIEVSKTRRKVAERASTLRLPISEHIPTTTAKLDEELSSLEKEAGAMARTSQRTNAMKTELVSKENEVLYIKGVFDPIDVPMKNRIGSYVRLSIRLFTAATAFKQLIPQIGQDRQQRYQDRIKKVQHDIKQSMLHGTTTEFVLWEGRAAYIVDEILACVAGSPVISVDRRPFEPLVANNDEFWPQIPLMLLEVDPRKKSFATDFTTPPQAYDLVRALLTVLMSRRGKEVHEALGLIGLDAGDDLIAEAPDITDPTKGGRLDHRQLKVQLLTRDMLDQLVEAFIEWPFRPTDAELRDIGVIPGQSDSGEDETEEDAPQEKGIGFEEDE